MILSLIIFLILYIYIYKTIKKNFFFFNIIVIWKEMKLENFQMNLKILKILKFCKLKVIYIVYKLNITIYYYYYYY